MRRAPRAGSALSSDRAPTAFCPESQLSLMRRGRSCRVSADSRSALVSRSSIVSWSAAVSVDTRPDRDCLLEASRLCGALAKLSWSSSGVRGAADDGQGEADSHRPKPAKRFGSEAEARGGGVGGGGAALVVGLDSCVARNPVTSLLVRDMRSPPRDTSAALC